MKIVMPVADLHIGGGCKVLVDIAGALTKRGHDVEIVIPKSGTVKYPIPCQLTVVPALTHETIPYGDLVLPNFYTTFFPAYQAWPEQCVRLSLGFEPLWVPAKEQALWTYMQGVPVISISRWLDDQIYRHTRKRSTVVSLGVDPAVFFADPARAAARAADPDRHKIILYIARAAEDGYALKGFNDFKEAMQIVHREWNGSFMIHLICPDRALSVPGLHQQAFFPANEYEMAELYRSSDVFVSSSWFEAFSLPPLEAMACGTPVVTTNSGGIMDFCTHMESAYVTAPQHPRRLAQGICAVLSDKQLASKLAHGGKLSAERLTHSRFETHIVDVLEEISSRRKW
ncbi:glycosyltransferase family 4 protein [Paenibacillus hexagrammi]|uniref:Glycosyltransferase family 4 protein n=1 Tax=Paenibacillus hexagrammi TaxID=2908839 RepID=A0ABY3SPA8_9BACL|nr:glycosyltransferase family 4 protein [Paenibacillus sp. YPD9-1]UJF35786.1 glycosyltransferase family 4 protein [Paenibacillus sp. YPD9-1]